MIEAKTAMERAFLLLAEAELGTCSTWPRPGWQQASAPGSRGSHSNALSANGQGPDEHRSLEDRVESLAILLDILPRSRRSELNSLVSMWSQHYSASRFVSADELRRITRRCLRTRTAQTATVPNFFATAASIAQQGRDADAAVLSSVTRSQTECSPTAEQHCVDGLQTWFEHLHRKQCWTHLPSVVPGDKPVAVNEMYVELLLKTDRSGERELGLGSAGIGDLPNAATSCRHPVPQSHDDVGDPSEWRENDSLLDIRTIVARTLNRCVIVGSPGSGKSTLIQWLAQEVVRGGIRDFDVPIVIELKQYARSLAEHPDLTPLQHFFRSLGNRHLDSDAASVWLRRVSRSHHRVLLMFDGWDEVPAESRANVREQLESEASDFVTLVTSRPSGVPQSLCDREHVDFYRIANLSSRSAAQLATNIIRNRFHSHPAGDGYANAIIEQIQSSAELRTLAKNPFLLGHVVHVLADASTRPGSLNAAKAIEQVVAWVRKQHNFVADPSNLLRVEHLQSLSRFAFDRLFAAERGREWFHETQLQQVTTSDGVSETPLLQSRFIDRGDAMIDEYRFSCPAFQTFFAALHVTSIQCATTQAAIFDQAIHASNRTEVLNHAVGLSEAFRKVSLERAAYWLRHGDGFHQILLRLAKLAAIARQAQGNVHANDAKSKDWSSLIEPIRNKLWRLTQESCDPIATRAYVQSLAELDPAFLLRKAISSVDLDEFVLRCIHRCLPDDSGFGGERVPRRNVTREGGDLPHATLVPLERDRVVRRLAALSPDHPEVKQGIQRLAGQSVRDGANVIMAIASASMVCGDVRATAIEIAMRSADQRILDCMANQIEREHDPRVQKSLLRLALERPVAFDLGWLETQIRKDLEHSFHSLMVRVYGCGAAPRTPDERLRIRRFFSDLVISAMNHGDSRSTGSLTECLRLVAHTDAGGLVDDRVVAVAIDRMIRFSKAPQSQRPEGVLLAARVLVGIPSLGNRIHLKKTLDVALDLVSSWSTGTIPLTEAEVMRRERFATAIAQCLVEVDCGLLLGYDRSCRPVQTALQSAAFEHGWLVFNERVLDRDGVEIAIADGDSLDPVGCTTSEAIQEIMHDLPPRQRSDFLSYWHMVCEGDADYVLTERETVHEAICTVMASDLNTELSERLWSCYQEGKPPSFASWKKNLARVVQRYENRPELLAHLQQLGLGIHKRKPR